MGHYKLVQAHARREPTIPKPDKAPPVSIVTVQDGVPVLYSESSLPCCGVRVIHPTQPKARSKNLGITMFYVPPHAKMDRHAHETEEVYCVLSGTGTLLVDGGEQAVGPGSFIHLPPWSVHGIDNTGNETLSILIATAPPNP